MGIVGICPAFNCASKCFTSSRDLALAMAAYSKLYSELYNIYDRKSSLTLIAAICSEDGPPLGASFLAGGPSPGTKLQ